MAIYQRGESPSLGGMGEGGAVVAGVRYRTGVFSPQQLESDKIVQIPAASILQLGSSFLGHPLFQIYSDAYDPSSIE